MASLTVEAVLGLVCWPALHRDLARETNSSREKTVTRPRFTREATLSTFELDSPSPAAALT